MAQFDTSLKGLHSFLGTSLGRDKLGKLVHYSARGVAGVAADLKEAYPKGTREQELAQLVHERARALFVRIMNSRRTLRWLSSTSVLLALMKPCPWDNQLAFYVAQLGMMWWHLTDHIRWLQQIKWLPGDQARSKRIGFSGFLVSAIVSFLYHFQTLMVKSGDKTEQQKNATRRQVVKHFVTVLACLHISEVQLLHESICGFSGAIAAAIDIYNIYPRKSV